jgi:predicted DNA-binding protein (UPF0251 family)
MRYRRRWRGRGRPPKPVSLGQTPTPNTFAPTILDNPFHIFLHASELEAMRLVDGEGLDQEEAGQRMEVSRGTVWRLLQSGRKKVVNALTENRPLTIITDTKAPQLDGESKTHRRD